LQILTRTAAAIGEQRGCRRTGLCQRPSDADIDDAIVVIDDQLIDEIRKRFGDLDKATLHVNQE
jgi:hypothetical protein